MSVDALLNKRVRRHAPTGFSPQIDADDSLPALAPSEEYSGWCFFVLYTNAQGIPSKRRLTLKSIEGYGDAQIIKAYCHERQQLRAFRIDRIRELVSLSTGELLSPALYFEECRSFGRITTGDKALFDFLKVLVFLAECDDEFHPLEREAIETALTSYILRFGGSEDTIPKLLQTIENLAPDGADFIASLARLAKHPEARSVGRLLENAMAAVVSSDGTVTSDEHEWLLAAVEAVKELRG